MNTWSQEKGWDDPHAVSLRDILSNARKLIADQDYSVRDAVYASAVNGESDSATMLALQREGLQFGVGPKDSVLRVFDAALAPRT